MMNLWDVLQMSFPRPSVVILGSVRETLWGMATYDGTGHK